MNRYDHFEPVPDSFYDDYVEGQEVDIVIGRETDLGWVASINGRDVGLLYASEVFRQLRVGDETPAYIKKIRPDGKIDLILQRPGYADAYTLEDKILYRLKEAEGFLPFNDATPAEVIYDEFGISKKKFKMAVGGLLRRRRIQFEGTGIRLAGAKS